jgi:hypothetical protein
VAIALLPSCILIHPFLRWSSCRSNAVDCAHFGRSDTSVRREFGFDDPKRVIVRSQSRQAVDRASYSQHGVLPCLRACADVGMA